VGHHRQPWSMVEEYGAGRAVRINRGSKAAYRPSVRESSNKDHFGDGAARERRSTTGEVARCRSHRSNRGPDPDRSGDSGAGGGGARKFDNDAGNARNDEPRAMDAAAQNNDRNVRGHAQIPSRPDAANITKRRRRRTPRRPGAGLAAAIGPASVA